MTSRDFYYWLQGFFELRANAGVVSEALTPEQATSIQKHLALVFKHEIDPSAGPPEHQAELNAIHNDKPKRPPIGGHLPGRPDVVFRC